MFLTLLVHFYDYSFYSYTVLIVIWDLTIKKTKVVLKVTCHCLILADYLAHSADDGYVYSSETSNPNLRKENLDKINTCLFSDHRRSCAMKLITKRQG
jgi:hypothetical protein